MTPRPKWRSAHGEGRTERTRTHKETLDIVSGVGGGLFCWVTALAVWGEPGYIAFLWFIVGAMMWGEAIETWNHTVGANS